MHVFLVSTTYFWFYRQRNERTEKKSFVIKRLFKKRGSFWYCVEPNWLIYTYIYRVTMSTKRRVSNLPSFVEEWFRINPTGITLIGNGQTIRTECRNYSPIWNLLFAFVTSWESSHKNNEKKCQPIQYRVGHANWVCRISNRKVLTLKNCSSYAWQ